MICNIWGKGMVKIVPILLGVIASYLFAVVIDPAARANVAGRHFCQFWFQTRLSPAIISRSKEVAVATSFLYIDPRIMVTNCLVR